MGLVLILLASTGLEGCGIETIAYLSSPIATIIQAGGVATGTTSFSFTFYHNTANNGADFKGYDLYYRCYADPYKAELDRQAIESLSASATAAPDSVLYSMVNSYKFSRMYDSTSSGTTPLLTFPSDAYKGSSVQYIVSITPASLSSGWVVSSTYGLDNTTATQSLFRSAYIGSIHKSFNAPTISQAADFLVSPQDGDYDGNQYAANGAGAVTGTLSNTFNVPYNAAPSLYLVVFAVALGLPQDNINLVPSLPATFGATIQIR